MGWMSSGGNTGGNNNSEATYQVFKFLILFIIFGSIVYMLSAVITSAIIGFIVFKGTMKYCENQREKQQGSIRRDYFGGQTLERRWNQSAGLKKDNT